MKSKRKSFFMYLAQYALVEPRTVTYSMFSFRFFLNCERSVHCAAAAAAGGGGGVGVFVCDLELVFPLAFHEPSDSIISRRQLSRIE